MWSLQNPYCGRDHPWAAWKHLLHQAWWNIILPVHSPQLWVITAHNLQHTMGKVQICPPPLGIACTQGIFQWMMDQILTHCNGVIGITDDVVIHGKDDKEHDKHHKFMRVTCEHGLVCYKDKCAVKQTSIAFFGCVYDANGAHPDPDKISAVHKMPVPKTATQLQMFLRLVTYLTPFIPSLSTFTAPLHDLLKKGTEFIWTTAIRKHLISSNQWFARIPHCGTSMSAGLSLSKFLGIQKRPRCCPPSRWPPSCLCFQSSYTCGAALCQHRMWTVHLCLWSRMIPHLCLWPCLHYWEWPQASWTDQHQEPGRYTCLSTRECSYDSKTMISP